MRTAEASQLQALRAVRSFLDRQPATASRRGHQRRPPAARRRARDPRAARDRSSRKRPRGARLHPALPLAPPPPHPDAHVVPAALVARAAEPPVPALQPFRLPRGKPTAHRLAAMACGMAEAAASHAERFAAAGLPVDFAAQLVRAAEAMFDAVTAREKERARRRGATEGLRTGLASVRRVVRVLDAFVEAECEMDPALLAGWESAMHARRAATRAAELPAVVPNTSFQLVMADAEDRQAAEPIASTTDAPRSVALRGRMVALLAGRGMVRTAVGA